MLTKQQKKFIKSWQWRIKRCGFKDGDFCKIADMGQNHFSAIVCGTIKQPKDETIQHIENTLQSLEREKGLRR